MPGVSCVVGVAMERTPIIYSVTNPQGTSRKWHLGWQHKDGIHRNGNDPSWTEEEMAVLFALAGAPMPEMCDRAVRSSRIPDIGEGRASG